MRRRTFIRKMAGGLALAAGSILTMGYLRQFFPRVAGRKTLVKVGKLSSYPVDTYSFLKDQDLFLYRDHEGVKAVSAVCTHLGCILDKSTDGFVCPCHGSHFDDQGTVLSGPAPRDLAWYAVSKDKEGEVIVDTGKVVGPDYKYLTS